MRLKLEGIKRWWFWGTGSPLREFLYVDNLAHGVVFLMDKYSGEWQGGYN